jgi:peptidoglycan hydrolase-like protein with peptidoglycan-binding domain
MVSEIGADLQRLGYDVGPADGRLGPRTEAAIRDYQQRYGLPVDGRPSVSRHD